MTSPLTEGVGRLETTARVTLAVLALASGVYTYLGVRELLNGNATVAFFAAVIDSVAVSVGIYAFWKEGRLLATGTIQPGSAELFAAEIAKRGGYIKTVVLHSPGGSVSDALAMGRLIRRHGFATEVERLCASSCPLVFAGGTERRAGEKAAIGVHQVFSAAPPGARVANPMNSAQRVSAECQKYLREMGVDTQVWVHAMETPKERLYYFKADELLTFKLATAHGRNPKPATEARKS